MGRNDQMHRKTGLTLLSLVFCLWTVAQPKTTTVIFEQTEWNFGKIEESDGKVSHSFKYSNSGDTPLLFYSVNSSCGCTTPTYRKEPLMPGQSADFVVTYDPAGRPGRFEKYVVIQGNMEGGNTVIKIKGVVEPRPRGIEDDFPILLSNGVRLSDSQMAAGAIANTRSQRMSVKFINTSDKPVKIGFAAESPDWLTTDNEKNVEPGQQTDLSVTILPKADTWGHQSAMLPIAVNEKRQPVEILVSADLTEDFSILSPEQRSNAPYIIVSSYFYSFSDCSCGEELKREFKISNRGKSPLLIRYLDFDDKTITADISSVSIEPGQTATLTICVDSSLPREVAQIVRVISNDPIYPVREIRIIANIL